MQGSPRRQPKSPPIAISAGSPWESGSALQTRLTVPPVSTLGAGLPFEVSRTMPIDSLLEMEGKVEAGAKSSPLAPRDQGLRSIKG